MAAKKSSMKSLRAYEKIRDMILKGNKLPGTRLILSELEQELKIGRSPIREALMRLDRSGLVKNIPYKGAVVAAPPTRKEILMIYDLRVDIESRLSMASLDNMTPAIISRLEGFHAKMETFPHNHYHYDRQFHYLLYETSGLPHLCNIAKELILSVESVLNIYRREKKHCRRFNREHQAIIEAVGAGDPQKVKAAVSVNIKSGLSIIKETYRELLHLPFD